MGMYKNEQNEEDFAYIRNQRNLVQSDFEEYLDCELHVHRTSAFLILSQDCRMGRCFPEENTISDVILLVNGMICEKIEEGEIVPAADERIFIPREMFTGILESCKELYGRGFIKTYREMTTGEFCENVKNYMLELGLIREEKDIWLSPAIGKVIGKYPEEFMKNGGSDEQ